jgi:hypothetical protein
MLKSRTFLGDAVQEAARTTSDVKNFGCEPSPDMKLSRSVNFKSSASRLIGLL